MSIEAMKLALFALDIVKIHYTQNRHINEAIAALKERLAQPEQEPVAWAMDYDIESVLSGFSTSLMGTAMRIESAFPKHRVKLLYTTPPQRTEQEPDDIASIIACRDMLDAQPVPEFDRVIWPERTWVGLTDDDDIDWEEGGNLKDLVKAIEAKLKVKNQ